jgi:crotonobetainyl-CoA:carnitine CoA-transferase CaiB-like acyl-CoA transferase
VYACDAEETWVALAVESDAQWAALQGVLGARENARWATRAGRLQHRATIDEVLAPWFACRSQADALRLLRAAGVPAEPVVAAYDVDQDEQMLARGFWEAVDHPLAGALRYPGWPVRLSAGPERWFRRPAPLLGEHNTEVLGELGLSDDEVALLRADGVIGDRPARL